MQESPRPGKTSDCATDPTDQWMEPKCKRLLLFLEGTDTYMDYRYYFCLNCRRIWESSMFYQDWEPHWTILSWDEFEAMTEKWIDVSGKDLKPRLAFENGLDSFEQWILGPDPGLSLRY